jgi:hypothetical protein
VGQPTARSESTPQDVVSDRGPSAHKQRKKPVKVKPQHKSSPLALVALKRVERRGLEQYLDQFSSSLNQNSALSSPWLGASKLKRNLFANNQVLTGIPSQFLCTAPEASLRLISDPRTDFSFPPTGNDIRNR